jgi:hypothetical protein
MKVYIRDRNVFLIGDRIEKVDNEDRHPYLMVPLHRYEAKKGYMSDHIIKYMQFAKANQGDEIFALESLGGKEKVQEMLD